ncbi:MAG: bifunctional DNA primase/polymerase, partial [Tepidisphaeraceae bacterium]
STEAEIRDWYRDGRTGIGLVTGAVSGIEMLEFEGRAVADGLTRQYRDLADAAGLGEVLDRIQNGYSERTPSGGYHLLYHVPTPLKSTKLAKRTAREVLIETRGKGGYCIVAPSGGSVHPTGQPWQMAAGGFETIATITDDERDELFGLARLLDQMPTPAPRPEPGTVGDRPGDRYNAAPDVGERTLLLLERHGWTNVYSIGGTIYLRRPGKKIGVSASLGYKAPGVLHVFTTSTEFESEHAYLPFTVYARLEHGGDFSAAGKKLEADASLGYFGPAIVPLDAEPVRLPPETLEPAAPRLIEPLICDSRTMWFGAQGVGKGVLVVFAAAALASGDAAFIPGVRTASTLRVGILDWEDNEDEYAERLYRLEVPAHSVPYLAPRGPLTNRQVAANVKAWINGEGVDLAAVDSVIPAAGASDAMKPEGPTAYYQVLRELERPTLSLAHVPKDKADAMAPFGSTYWSTPSRLVWRVEKLAEDSASHVMQLTNTKHSRWPQASPLLLKVGWTEQPLRLHSALSLTMERDALPLVDRMVLSIAAAGRPLTAEELASRTGNDDTAIRKTATRNPGRISVSGTRPRVYGPA